MGGLQTGLQKEEDKAHIAAVIRYTFTDDTRNIYELFNLSKDDNNKPGVIIARLEEFAKGLINETLEKHIFNSRKQEDGKCFDDFLTELKLLSRNCNYCEGCYENFSDNSKCNFRVGIHPFGRNNCPAWGKKRFECQGMNHFAKSTVCGANTK